MKNKIWIFFLILLLIIIGISAYFFIQNQNNPQSNTNYKTSKLSTNDANNSNSNDSQNEPNSDQNISQNSTSSITENNNPDAPTPENTVPNSSSEIIKEEAISNFSTKIYDKSSARQNNVKLTCTTLNDTIVANGTTFSFCNTIGPSTSAKGYQKADIFDKYGNKKKGFGGGNCQVSTTLYNAVLSVPSLQVTERHQHSNKVTYISNGKDAAVAYGSYDLKFVNNSGYNIKIRAEANTDNITITLLKLS